MFQISRLLVSVVVIAGLLFIEYYWTAIVIMGIFWLFAEYATATLATRLTVLETISISDIVSLIRKPNGDGQVTLH